MVMGMTSLMIHDGIRMTHNTAFKDTHTLSLSLTHTQTHTPLALSHTHKDLSTITHAHDHSLIEALTHTYIFAITLEYPHTQLPSPTNSLAHTITPSHNTAYLHTLTHTPYLPFGFIFRCVNKRLKSQELQQRVALTVGFAFTPAATDICAYRASE